MEQKYLSKIHRHFKVTSDERDLFESTARFACSKRSQILKNVNQLARSRGLAYGLLALYRQQVNCGFVLADPIKPQGRERKEFKDETSGVTFRLIWNPDRELRRNHELLIERGVITEDVDQARLINRDKDGKPCYLCSENIALQNPSEILFPLTLGREIYFLGANFAYIDNNHFTLMSSVHRDQKYCRHVLTVLHQFVDQTTGYFRAIFNGLAGATILRHEHLQVTSVRFPIEDIRIRSHDVVFEGNGITVSRPFYYIPLWVVEGQASPAVADAAHLIITNWHELNKEYHTVNVIGSRVDTEFRMFIFLRDTRRLAGEGKSGDMASFECGGSIVLSYCPPPERSRDINERETFESANVSTVRRLLGDIAPLVPDVEFRSGHVGPGSQLGF